MCNFCAAAQKLHIDKSMSLTTILGEFGLSENEVKVYLANLELATATVQELGKKSGVKRTTVYTVIEGLKEKGLVSQSKKAKKTMFVAESPDSLLALSQKRHEALKQAIPELKSIYNVAGDKPKVRFYEGKEGYLTVYENILKEKPKELLVIASYEDFKKHIDERYEDGWTQRRIKQGTFLRWLDFKTPSVKAKASEGKKGLREIRFLPKEFVFSTTMFIYNEKVTIVSGRQKDFMAVVIENAEFFETFRQLFEIVWLKSKS